MISNGNVFGVVIPLFELNLRRLGQVSPEPLVDTMMMTTTNLLRATVQICSSFHGIGFTAD